MAETDFDVSGNGRPVRRGGRGSGVVDLRRVGVNPDFWYPVTRSRKVRRGQVIGTAFAAQPEWQAFYFYPLLSLEATLVAGMRAGVAVTAISIVVYGAQLFLHQSYGLTVSSRSIAKVARSTSVGPRMVPAPTVRPPIALKGTPPPLLHLSPARKWRGRRAMMPTPL